ncbi:MAG: putative RNA methyltransferase [Planctomycetota bacterium]
MAAPPDSSPLACPVRGCGRPLVRQPRAWSCARGHSFDVARRGYVNLLQPGDRRSRAAGDSPAALAARERLEARGLGEELRAALAAEALALALPPGARALDVGAGTGLLLARLAGAARLEGWALDLSAAAAERGARRHPELAWVVANADRRLPFAAGAFALLVSCTGPKHPREFRRVLALGGVLLLAVPGADDLIELRAALTGRGRPIERAAKTLSRFGAEFRGEGRQEIRARANLDRAGIEDLLAASYRGARHAERRRLGALDALAVTLATEILRLRAL